MLGSLLATMNPSQAPQETFCSLVKRGEKWALEKLGDSLGVTACAGIEAWIQGLAVNRDIKRHRGHLLVASVSQSPHL